MMKFKITLQDGTIVYANDICIYEIGVLTHVSIWANGEEIDSILISRVKFIHLLYDNRVMLIYL